MARIITRLNIGGPAIQAVNLSERLESRGYHTLLIHGRIGQGEGDMSYLIPPDHRFETAYLPALHREIAPAADAAALAQIAGRLRRFRPAIIHTHMAKAGSLGRLAAVFYNAARPRRARMVHTYHGHVLEGYFGALRENAFSAAERFLARRSDAILAVSPRVGRDLVERHGIGSADRVRIVPLGFDLEPFAAIDPAARRAARDRLAIAAEARVVAFVGRLTAIKQPDLFLDAAARIGAADEQVQFLVAGGGELETALRARAHELGIAGRVRFLGWQRDVAAIYAASDLVAITSRNEGTPVTLIESMAAAVPAVCFAVGGIPDVITGPELGVLIDAGEVEALARAIADLLRRNEPRALMGMRARAHALERYGVVRLVRDIDSLYRELLGHDS